MVRELIWLVAGGAAGTLCRYGVSSWAQQWGGPRFPLGTLAVNVLGCFLFGLIWSLAEERLASAASARLFILTGFMGAFTTFSTFGFETMVLAREGQWGTALLNVGANNVLGLAGVLLGLAAGRSA